MPKGLKGVPLYLSERPLRGTSRYICPKGPFGQREAIYSEGPLVYWLLPPPSLAPSPYLKARIYWQSQLTTPLWQYMPKGATLLPLWGNPCFPFGHILRCPLLSLATLLPLRGNDDKEVLTLPLRGPFGHILLLPFAPKGQREGATTPTSGAIT